MPPFTLNHCFGKNASIGRGDGGALRGSTGREFRFQRQSQKRFRKERRKVCGPALNHGKTTALWFREARRHPRAPPGAPKYLIPLVFRKSEVARAVGHIRNLKKIPPKGSLQKIFFILMP